MTIDVSDMDFRTLNERLRNSSDSIEITGCLGQRFIAAGFSGRKIRIHGTPGNALGAYLNGAEITVCGNAQDAVGDTMNNGRIIVHGNIGDAAGYAMRGGEIYVKGNAGYRAGIHMKEYGDKRPVLVIGGKCGSFLGEYQAGGLIIVLGLTDTPGSLTGNYPFTGMHGGRVFIRTDGKMQNLSRGVSSHPASAEDIESISRYLTEFCTLFGYDIDKIKNSAFIKIEPDGKNPYKQMYVAN